MSSSFLSSKNQTTILNILLRIPLFNECISPAEQTQWIEQQMALIYSHNEQHAKESKLIDFNKDAISILIGILKQLKQSRITEASSSTTFEPVEDTAITNLEELVEQQRRNRDLDILPQKPPETSLEVIELDNSKTVTWYDERKTNEYDEKIMMLEEQMRDLKEQLSSIKNTTYIDVCQTMNSVIRIVSGEN